MNKKPLLICLAMIFLIAAGFRFFGLAGRGLFYPDETRYYRDSLAAKKSIDNYFIAVGPKTFKGAASALLPLVEALAAKPGHTFLGVLGLYLFGAHQHSVLFVSAISGIATVFLVFAIGSIYNTKVGTLSAMILSVCAAHVFFSRSFLAHADQAFFLVLAAYLYLTKRKKMAAFSSGYAFLAHPTGIIYFMPFLFCETLLWLKKRQGFIKVITFCICFLIPFIALEAISVLGRKEFGSLVASLDKSYMAQILFVSGEAKNLGLLHNKNLGPFHFLIMSCLANGVIFTLITVVSVIVYLGRTFREDKIRNLIIGVAPAALFVYWQFFSAHERLFREIIVLFPFFCIMTAIFISRLSGKLAIVICALIISEGFLCSSMVLISDRSRYAGIEKFMIENRIDKIVSPSQYLATTHDLLIPGVKQLRFYPAGSIDEAEEVGREEGVDYIITMPGDRILNSGFVFRSLPLITVKEPTYAYLPSFYEAMKIEGRSEYLNFRKGDPVTRSVAIYDLRKEKAI